MDPIVAGRQAEAWPFGIVGGHLCLDFANTVSWRKTAVHSDRLATYADLLSWARGVGVLTDAQGLRLIQESIRRPADADAVLAKAVRLREALHRIFSTISRRSEPSRQDLDIVNAAVTTALTKLRLVPRDGAFAWAWDADPHALDQVLWPVARSAVELLTSDRLDRIKECADDRCGWLFLDTTKNRIRRWCSMSDCGNRAKVRRYYRRSRATSSTRDAAPRRRATHATERRR